MPRPLGRDDEFTCDVKYVPDIDKIEPNGKVPVRRTVFEEDALEGFAVKVFSSATRDKSRFPERESEVKPGTVKRDEAAVAFGKFLIRKMSVSPWLYFRNVYFGEPGVTPNWTIWRVK